MFFFLFFFVLIFFSVQNITAKWYKEVIHYCPDVPLILVGTKLDLREDPATISKLQSLGQAPISTAKGQELASKISAFRYMECSALSQAGLKDVFDTVRVVCSFLFLLFALLLTFLFRRLKVF